MFKVGDKIRCIDSRNTEKHLTNGKIYDVTKVDNYEDWVYVKSDKGIDDNFFPYRFELVNDIKKETKKMKFVPMTDLEVISVNGIDGILIPE